VFFISLLNIALLLIIIWFLYKKARNEPLRHFFVVGLVLKILGGISLGLVYSHYYQGGDTFIFYREAVRLKEFFYESPGGFFSLLWSGGTDSIPAGQVFWDQPRALLFSAIISLLLIITFSNYWIIGMYLSVFSFWGLWVLANRIVQYYPRLKLETAIALLIFPSTIFWSSGLLKESFVMGLMAIVLSIFLELYRHSKISWLKILISTIIFIIIFQLKYYYVAILIPVLFSTVIVQVLKNKVNKIETSFNRQVKIWIVVFITITLAATSMHPNLNLDRFLEVLVLNHDLTLQASPNSGHIHFYNLTPEISSVLVNLPLAWIGGLFLPLPFQSDSMLAMLTGVENLIILIFSVAAIANCIKMSLPSSTDRLLIFACLVYCCLLGALLALSTPNYGTLARYKVGFLPFFLLLILSANPWLQRLKEVPWVISLLGDKKQNV